ncbi:TadE/TadG family type IV pilus assembly protein [Arthrobacter halodurans]|uniref:TadE/TadG family type IV pilus assembly protein n=1 Tax=Arthrobacter halodurans TaxID=516699 RepID=A0ABV4UP23_9MICC
MSTQSDQREFGSSAVEFALLLPVLLTLILGIVEFGYAFNQQISLTQGAREAARHYAIHASSAPVSSATLTATARAAAPMAADLVASSVPASGCPSGTSVTVTTIRNYTSLTGWFDFAGNTVTLTSKAAMRCGG